MISLIPISDSNPTRRFPIMTVTIILVNVAIFFLVEPGFGQTCRAQDYFALHAAVPCQVKTCPSVPVRYCSTGAVQIPQRGTVAFLGAMVFATFLHAGFLHIGGNMLFLWVFGNNIEDFLGRFRYVVFYLLGGLAAGFTQVFTHLHGIDRLIPAVGASGAIAAVMGAYLVLFPRARIRVLVPIFILFTVVQLSAFVVLGLWFVFQFFTGADTGVAWMAHVGGFLFGVIAIYLLGGRPDAERTLYPSGWR
ncbi:MAG: rhomboid family intramembrane serine protease [Actinomycetota bacterium]|nr:rhomboid family intramembrane serine protease [Actinomycetota bacterium]